MVSVVPSIHSRVSSRGCRNPDLKHSRHLDMTNPTSSIGLLADTAYPCPGSVMILDAIQVAGATIRWHVIISDAISLTGCLQWDWAATHLSSLLLVAHTKYTSKGRVPDQDGILELLAIRMLPNMESVGLTCPFDDITWPPRGCQLLEGLIFHLTSSYLHIQGSLAWTWISCHISDI